MKNVGTMLVAVALLLIFSTTALAQSEGDYRTRDNGNWSMAQIWERYNGTAWVAIGTPPTGAETITVLSDDSVFVNSPISITGTLINQGIVDAVDSLTITIAGGGTYQHDRDAGGIPQSIWAEGSTLLMTGVTATAPDDRAQDYYNIIFDTPGLLANLNMNLDDNTIGGDIQVINTGLARWYLTSTQPNDTAIITIMGDVIVESGAFSVQGTSNAQTTFIVHHYGNIEVTGGNFSIARGSQPLGTTTWYLYEGDLSMSNATTQNSNLTPDGAKFIFAKEGTQTLTIGENNTLTALPIEVSSGTTLDMGASVLAGSGNFTLRENATLFTSLPMGVSQIFELVVGQVALEDGSSFGFNGTEAQVTSTRMPAIVTDLIIDNEAGVVLTQETTINGVLRLVAGVFDNTIPFTLDPNGSISYEGGSLSVPVSVEATEPAVPQAFFLDQNYPNPFNPSTTIRFGLPAASHVMVKVFNMLGQEVATLFDGRKNAGVHTLQFEAANLPSGVYLFRVQAGDVVSMKRMVLLR